MAVLTAAEARAREFPEVTVDLGDGTSMLARRPDLQLMVLHNLLPGTLVADVVRMLGEWVGTPVTQLTAEFVAESASLLTAVDSILCEAMLQPRLVRTEEERAALGGEALLPSEMTIETKKKVVMAIANPSPRQREVAAAARTFPAEPAGEGAGPDVPALQPAAV